jgi:hypothetical protein
MQKSRPLSLLRLEDRCTPANSGVTWADGQHLTLSFVPDGAQIGAASSSLFSTLNAIAPTAVWQREIVRAFQAWAVNANINIGVVSDGGQALGTVGEVQGDDRFGDIRIAAMPLPTNTLITNTPFQWSGTTWSGDVVINTAVAFRIGGASGGIDLFSAMLNEAGNVLGVVDSRTDHSSAVYYQYTGVRSGLNSADIADIVALYGARAPDGFDAVHSNDSLLNASNLGGALAQPVVDADISTTGDVDFYRFTLPLSTPLLNMTVKEQSSGLSSLQSSLLVYNAWGQVVGSANAGAPGADLSVTLNGLLLGGTYYVRVAGNGNSLYGVGGYRLALAYTLLNGSIVGGVTNLVGSLSSEVGLNDLLSTATNVLPPIGQKADARFDYTTRATIVTPLDVDYYRVTAPGIASGTQKLNVLAWSLELNALKPKVEVFDANGNLLATTLVGNEGGTFGVELPNSTPGAVYYVKVSALNPNGVAAVGDYFLGVNFSTQPATEFQMPVANTISQATAVQTSTYTVTQNKLMEFMLSADSGTAWTEMRMEILDAGGDVVFTLSAYAGTPAASGHIYLSAGQYTARFTATPRPGTTFTPVGFTLLSRLVSDPIGPRQASSSSSPPGDTWSGNSTQTANGTSDYQPPRY